MIVIGDCHVAALLAMTLPKVARRIRESCRCGWIGYIFGDSVKEKEIRESADSMVENFAIVRLILTFAKNSELWLEQLQ